MKSGEGAARIESTGGATRGTHLLALNSPDSYLWPNAGTTEHYTDFKLGTWQIRDTSRTDTTAQDISTLKRISVE